MRNNHLLLGGRETQGSGMNAKHFLELGGAARPRELWYRDLGAVPGEDYLFYPVPDPRTADLEAAIGVIYEEQATPVSTIFFATIRGKPIKNQAEHKDYFDTEEAAMDAVERAVEVETPGTYDPSADIQAILSLAMAKKVARDTGTDMLLPEKEPLLTLLSCGECPECKALSGLLDFFGVGTEVDYRSAAAGEILQALQRVELDAEERGLVKKGHPILLANGEIQAQFARKPATPEVLGEWYEDTYDREL
jgi:hypothetical protein